VLVARLVQIMVLTATPPHLGLCLVLLVAPAVQLMAVLGQEVLVLGEQSMQKVEPGKAPMRERAATYKVAAADQVAGVEAGVVGHQGPAVLVAIMAAVAVVPVVMAQSLAPVVTAPMASS